MHFFNPAHLLTVVEVVYGRFTSGRAVATVFKAAHAMRKVGYNDLWLDLGIVFSDKCYLFEKLSSHASIICRKQRLRIKNMSKMIA